MMIKNTYQKLVKTLLLLFSEAAILFLLLFTALIVFLFTAKMVFIDERLEFDLYVFKLLLEHVNPTSTAIMLFFTQLGSSVVITTGNLLLIAYFLFLKKRRWFALKVPAVSLSSLALMLSLKSLFNRPRPLSPLLYQELGLSFPSGHALSAVTFYGLIIYLISISSLTKQTKFFINSLLVFIIFMVGLSRIYLRVHYTSDVIAGFCAGILWLWLAVKILNGIEKFSRRELGG
ncbi:phosphatase PAP2 family protein [Pedobacter aquae]|uniref:Phosphatase PAP2 family protein n=1 Tax=Pedobacter aquae TaxID=2605747 RepID=A0A5C0VG66_9SPHI|nr:phosphatase PAP2 family protein [Pedobacter aquae]QEK51027.1 phosphatase PAP2 family protein [Pedobacter aquae]